MKVRIHKAFEVKYKSLLKDEYAKLEMCMMTRPKDSIRVNTLKISKDELLWRLEKMVKFTEIPWYKNGLFVDGAVTLAKTLEHFMGFFHIQDAASMIPPIVLAPRQDDFVLDMCASPGSKTTQIAMMMNDSGLIVANDNGLNRIKPLQINLKRMGVKNGVVTYGKGEMFWRHNVKFDKILLDVPCSGSGKIISSASSLDKWSQRAVEKMSRMQKNLLSSAVKCLKEEGSIVYSTCSMDPEENEEVIDFAVKELGLKTEAIKIDGLICTEVFMEYRNKTFDSEVSKAIRIHPYHNFTEGFFVCKLKK